MTSAWGILNGSIRRPPRTRTAMCRAPLSRVEQTRGLEQLRMSLRTIALKARVCGMISDDKQWLRGRY